MAGVKTDIHGLKCEVGELRGHQRQDFRVLFGSLIAATLALAGLMAKGFGWVH
jgi:hypothetical protein